MDGRSGFRGKSGSFRWSALLALTAGMVTSILVGTGGVARAAVASGSPLTFGMVATESGSYALPEEGQAVRAYVANWNSHGGYKGHPVRVIELDGGIDPAMTADAARTLVNTDGAIAMINFALLDCPVNNSFYASSHVAVIGEGTTGCYIPNIDFPQTKLGGSDGISVFVKYLAEKGAKHIGLITPSYAGDQSIINGSAAEAKALHLQFNTYFVPIVATAADFDGVIAQMKAAGVDAVVPQGQTSQNELMFQEANRQGFGPANHIQYVFGPNMYDPRTTASTPGVNIYTYGYPWTTSQGKAAFGVLRHSSVKVSSVDGFAQQAYQLAGEFQEVLDSVKGPVTRASFLKAAEHATAIQVPLNPQGFTVNLAHPTKDKVGGFIVKSNGSAFYPVSGFVVTNH